MTSQLAEPRAERQLPAGRGRGPGSTLPEACRCPVPDCAEQIDPSRLMCRKHWYRVPRQLRALVWATWRSGEGAHSSEHREAVRLAVSAC